MSWWNWSRGCLRGWFIHNHQKCYAHQGVVATLHRCRGMCPGRMAVLPGFVLSPSVEGSNESNKRSILSGVLVDFW